MGNFFSLESMWTPRVIHFIYIIGLVLILLTGVVGVFSLFSGFFSFGQGVLLFFLYVIGTFVGIVMWRIWCELVIVMFKLLERMTEVRDALNKR